MLCKTEGGAIWVVHLFWTPGQWKLSRGPDFGDGIVHLVCQDQRAGNQRAVPGTWMVVVADSYLLAFSVCHLQSIISRLDKNVIITTMPSGQWKLYLLQDTLFCLRGALIRLRAASTYGLRHPSGGIMPPSGRIMCPSGGIISIVLRAGL